MFHGSMVALVTPMKMTGEIDFERLEALIEHHINHKTDAIVVAGTTGESAILSQQEKEDLIKFTVDKVNERIPVIAGTAANQTQQAINLTKRAMELGVDAALIMTPAYIKPTQEGLYQHYKAIAEAVALPQILYNVPSRTACDLLPETVERLATISNIIGLKEATGSLKRFLDVYHRCGDKLDIYSGDDLTAKDLILLGGRGSISVTANVAPKLCHELCQAALDGNKEKAEEIQERLIDLHKNLFLEANPIPVKFALAEQKLIEPMIRLPLTWLSGEYHAPVKQAMARAGV